MSTEESDDQEIQRRRQTWVQRRIPKNAVCSQCASTEISSLPTFSTGSGIAHRPLAEDVFCRRCGHIDLPRLVTL